MAAIVSLLSLAVALAAVSVAVWQVRRSTDNVIKSNSLPILSQVASEWRSPEMRRHRDRLLDGPGSSPPTGGFQTLPAEFRDSAEQWCFFCEGLGLAIIAGLVPEELIISMMGTQIIEVWLAMEPYIAQERRHRTQAFVSEVPAEFLPHYEHLVVRIIELGGRGAGVNIRKKMGVKKLARPIATTRSGLTTP